MGMEGVRKRHVLILARYARRAHNTAARSTAIYICL